MCNSTTTMKKSRGMQPMVQCLRRRKCRERSKEQSYGHLPIALASLIGPSTILTDEMGILDGLWRGEEGCLGPKQKDADLWKNGNQ